MSISKASFPRVPVQRNVKFALAIIVKYDPANNWTFSERFKNVPSSFYGRFVKTFRKRPFVEGFGR